MAKTANPATNHSPLEAQFFSLSMEKGVPRIIPLQPLSSTTCKTMTHFPFSPAAVSCNPVLVYGEEEAAAEGRASE